MVLRLLVGGTLAISAAGCATRPSPTVSAPDASTPGRRSPDVIDASELADPALANVDALTIIKRLRPTFLSTRGAVSANTTGGDLHVVIDTGPFRTSEALSTIRGEEMIEIRYLSASAAAQRFGSRALAGPVIVIRRK